ncbi:hypothetical protein H8E88_09230 [candidate division KSB1 bacterium]|nr:hypothetical protein [candidate division KSB1 bacterium]
MPKGTRFEHPVSALDLFPTCIATSGGEVLVSWKLDGVNLLPFLKGESTDPPHEYLFWRLWRVAAIRKGDWKLIRVAENPLKPKRNLLLPLMLFNLKNDPGETINLVEQYPDKAQELLLALERWEQSLVKPRWYDGSKWQHWQEVSVENHRMN